MLQNYPTNLSIMLGLGRGRNRGVVQSRSDGGYTPKSVYLKFFYVVVLSPCND